MTQTNQLAMKTNPATPLHKNLLNLHKQAALHSKGGDMTGINPAQQKIIYDHQIQQTQTGGYWDKYYETKYKDLTVRVKSGNIKSAASYIFNVLMRNKRGGNKIKFTVREVNSRNSYKLVGVKERNTNKHVKMPFVNKLMFV